MQTKRATRKSTKLSQDKKQQQLRQLDADWETISCRKTLVPNTSKKLFGVPWPDVHAEMAPSELIAARASLAVTLADIFEEQHIGFYKDADSACKTLSTTVTTLQGLFMSSSAQQQDLILPQYLFATTYMESAVELLTCKMLDPTSHQNFRRGGGPLWLRIHTGPHWKTIEKKMSREIQEVQTLVMIGDMLIGGFKGGQWEFVRGVLVTVGVFGSAKGRDSGEDNAGRACLLTKADCLKRIEEREGTGMDTCANGPRAQVTVSTPLLRLNFPQANNMSKPRQNYYGPLAISEDLAACGPIPGDGRGIGILPPHVSRSNLALHSFKKQLQISSTDDCTSSNAVPLGSFPPKGLKRLLEQENKHYRETGAQGDSESSGDEDGVGEINEKNGSWKRPKLNPDMRLLAEPEPGPSSQETPAMRRVRMEIEGVRICEGGGVAELPGIFGEWKGGTNAVETGREEQVL